jgi:hypothetical protein
MLTRRAITKLNSRGHYRSDRNNREIGIAFRLSLPLPPLAFWEAAILNKMTSILASPLATLGIPRGIPRKLSLPHIGPSST